MTAEEARTIIRWCAVLGCEHCNKPCDKSSDKRYVDFCSAIKIAKEALEKQIPKKPLNVGYINFEVVADCPNCKHVITDINSPCGCKHCLQAIDWSEV